MLGFTDLVRAVPRTQIGSLCAPGVAPGLIDMEFVAQGILLQMICARFLDQQQSCQPFRIGDWSLERSACFALCNLP